MRTGFAAAVAAVTVLTAVVLPAQPAQADSAPQGGEPATVTADALPTVQINGVVWSQAVVGNTVYVGGSFSTARPAGALPGQNTTPRNNLLAFNITTGNLIASWNPDANGQVRAVAVSPDGTRLYVGGDFTSIGGVARYRIAAFDTATGALDTSFNAGLDYQVRALAATNSTVYAGGAFSSANGQARSRLAAFAASTGALLPWSGSPSASVSAVAVSPSGNDVYVGGSFTSFNGSTNPGYGLARLHAVTGALLALPANTEIRNGGANGGILALKGDADNVYAVGYTYGRDGGTLEGIAAIRWDTAALRWVADCHGDHYSVHPQGGVVYAASHTHYCANIGGLGQTDPSSNWDYYRATAVTQQATRIVGKEPLGYTNFEGQPGPSQLNFFPDLDTGTYTGQDQGPWNVTGNAQYVVYGGEFEYVNFARQQGLVRFGVSSVAPNTSGPRFGGAGFPITTEPIASGAVRISWQANADFDNEFLTYRVIRNSATGSPVYTAVKPSRIWRRPMMGFTDTGLTPGATYTYRVTVSDPFGNVASSPSVSVTADGTGALSTYANEVMKDGANYLWRLGESSGSVASDLAATNDGSIGGGVTLGGSGAIGGDPDRAARLSASSNGRILTSQEVLGPNYFSIEAWVKAGRSDRGRIVGFSNGTNPTGTSTRRDRHIYMDDNGRINFGIYAAETRVIQSGSGYNDNQWHHVVATMGADGTRLYVDGVQVAARADATTAQNYFGYWRIGGDSLTNWPNQPSTDGFGGFVDEVAIYSDPMPASTVLKHYQLGQGANQPPVAAFSATTAGLGVNVDGSASSDPNGAIASYTWTFGDGSTGTGATASHTYAAAGTYNVTLTVTDGGGLTNALTKQVTVAPANQPPVAAFTSSTAGRAVSVNGSSSSDVEGPIATYAWTFGDGGTGTGAITAHTYAAAGTYAVTLTVTDSGGLTASTTEQVTVVDAPTPFARDQFQRSAAGGWGAADIGGPWTLAGTASNFSVSGGTGQMVMSAPGAGLSAILAGVMQEDVDASVLASLDKNPTGGGTDLTVSGRWTGSGNEYRTQVKVLSTGGVRVALRRVVGGSATTLSQVNVPGLSYSAGQQLRIRIQVEGTSPTTLRTKVWLNGTSEPSAWLMETTDSTAALQAPGGVGLVSYVSGSAVNTPVVASFDEVWAAPVTGAPNTPPTSAFTSSTTGLAVSVNGTTSSDAEGPIASYAWQFGDGGTGTGVTTSHTYAAAGTYTVTLTVIDAGGLTNAVSHPVTVTSGGVTPFAQDLFERLSANGWGSAGIGGAWTLAGASSGYSVSGGQGRMVLSGPGAGRSAILAGINQQDVDASVLAGLDKDATGGGTDLSLAGRWTGAGNEYRTQVKVLSTGGVRVALRRVVSGSATTLAQVNVPGLRYAAGEQLHIRLQVAGASPTTLRTKVWLVGAPEPTTWLMETTDSTPALQAPGGVGLFSYVSGSATNTPAEARFDEFRAAPLP